MPVTLPDNPTLDQLRRDARALQRAVRAGDPEAIAGVKRLHPTGTGPDPTTFALTAAQLVVARRCGFTSWPRLKRYLDIAGPLRRDPLSTIAESDADEFCALACLQYTPADDPQRWSRAADLLLDQPEIVTTSIHAAAAAGDADAITAQLAEDPSLARRPGGPFRWAPLMYLAYSRVAPSGGSAGAVETASMLLDAGADPNDGYLWRGMPTPFTVLTGVLGGGELGEIRQPPHPASEDLARLLLERGADPNDGQVLYNRMFFRSDEHLRLLAQFGLGSGDGGPWRRRLTDALDSPADLLRQQLSWAIEHQMTDRVAVLISCGVDVREALPSWPSRALAGLTPVAAARRCGAGDAVDLLVGAGAQDRSGEG
jgi:hypothetical protein